MRWKFFKEQKDTISVEMKKGFLDDLDKPQFDFQLTILLLFRIFTFTLPFPVTSASFSHPIK